MDDIKRKIKNFQAGLRRRARRPAISKNYICRGGPFDGQSIRLTTEKTLIFRVQDYKGYYACSTYHGKHVEWFPLQ